MKCDHVNCDKEAITKGFVLARNPDGGKEIPTDVFACDKHRKKDGFFK